LGYWPPGPGCPLVSVASKSFNLLPKPDISTSGCPVGMGTIGYMVTGAAIFGLSDGKTYNSAYKVWSNLATEFEAYDVDVCGGHAANGVYHHHFYSQCIAEKLSDVGTSHSLIWGWIQDGYPIYGPYQSNGVLAASCWKARDYASATTGCSGGGRTCTLINQLDYTKGKVVDLRQPYHYCSNRGTSYDCHRYHTIWQFCFG